MEETVYIVEEDSDEEETVKMSCGYNRSLWRLTDFVADRHEAVGDAVRQR